MESNAIFLNHSDAGLFRRTMLALSRHVSGAPLVTGSIAAVWNLITNGGNAKRIRLNDIDIVVAAVAEIGENIASDLLIHHFHPTREAGNVLLQLVDARTATRIDVFSARSAGIGERAAAVEIDGIALRMAAAEDLTARLAAILAAVTDGKGVEAKYLDSFRRLEGIADREVVIKLWQEYRRQGDNADFSEIVREIKDAIALDAGLLTSTEYSRDLNTRYQWCVQDDRFPLAKPEDVFAILGHV